MNLLIHTKSPLILAGILTVSIALTGCGGGGGGGSKSSAAASSKPASSVTPSSLAASSAPASSNAAESSVPVNTSSTPASSISSVAPSSVAASSTPASFSSSAASVNILANLIRDGGGLFSYTANVGVVNRSALVGSANETYESYDGSAFVATTAGDASYAFVLTANGWIKGKNENKAVSFNVDGSVVTTNATDWDIGKTLRVKEEIDLTGKNVLELLASAPNTIDMLATVNPVATFTSGAKAFTLDTGADESIYSVYFEPGNENGKCWWDGGDLASESGGNCMAVNMTADANILEKFVSGYAKLFSTDVVVNTAGYRAVIIGEVGPNKLEMQIINNAQKSVKFYENSPNTNFSKLLASGTWSEITLPYLTVDNKAVHVEIPESLLDVYIYGTSVTYGQQNGYLRPLVVNKSTDQENIYFNARANTDITNATANYKNPLVGNWSMGGSDIFIFSDNNTFTHVKTVTDDPNCLVGSAIGSYSWNPITTELNVKLGEDSTAWEAGDSCSIGGESKLAVNSNAIVLEIDEGEKYSFPKSTSTTGLVGTWVQKTPDDFAVVVFTGTHYFISDYIKQQGYGTEHGTYTYNSGLGELTATVLADANYDAGFSNAEGEPLPLVIANDNNSFTVGDGFVLKRLK